MPVAQTLARTAFRALRKMQGVTANYSRGAETSADLVVVPGNRFATVENSEGQIVQSRARDVLILASELIVGGQRILPDRHDKIEIKDSAGMVIQTMLVDTSPAYDDSDAFGVVIRVHAKLVERVVPTVGILQLFAENGVLLRDASGNYLGQLNT